MDIGMRILGLEVASAAASQAAELRVPQPSDGVVGVQAIARPAGRLDVPSLVRQPELVGDGAGQSRLFPDPGSPLSRSGRSR
jgi:hypothetical protein